VIHFDRWCNPAVNEQDLIAKASKGIRTSAKKPKTAKLLHTSKLSDVFGIDFAAAPRAKTGRRKTQGTKRKPLTPPTSSSRARRH
jgi:hypothetical protein